MTLRRTIIFNSHARSAKAEALKNELVRVTNGCDLRSTTGLGGGVQHANQAVRDGYGVIIAAGGDGTIHEVVSGTVGTNMILGIIPIGTINVVARELGIPLNMAGAWKVIEEGHVREVDLVRVEYRGREEPEVRHFVQMAGVGLDAQIVKQVTWEQKKRWGALSYVIELCKVIHAKLPRVTVCMDDSPACEGAFALIGNGSMYGGPVRVFNRASMSDGLMDVCISQSGGYMDLLVYVQAVLRGRQDVTRGMIYRQCRTVEFTSSAETPIELDGEYVGCLPARMTVVPRALKILAPRGAQTNSSSGMGGTNP